MRLMVFFDLPTETAKDRRNYTLFRKLLIKEGFIMMQESIYVKLALNNSKLEAVKQKLHKRKTTKWFSSNSYCNRKAVCKYGVACTENQQQMC